MANHSLTSTDQPTQELDFTTEDLEMLRIYRDQVALAIQTATDERTRMIRLFVLCLAESEINRNRRGGLS